MTRKQQQTLSIGALSPGGKGQHWVEPDHRFPAPRLVCNATASGTYAGPRWQIRAGGEVHKQFRSRGHGC
jgi:hypothetical protein